MDKQASKEERKQATCTVAGPPRLPTAAEAEVLPQSTVSVFMCLARDALPLPFHRGGYKLCGHLLGHVLSCLGARAPRPRLQADQGRERGGVLSSLGGFVII